MIIKRNHRKQNHATSLRHSNLIFQVELGPAPLLWEIGNNALRPIVYFMTNPAVWDGFAKLFCRKKHYDGVNDHDEEAEVPLAPVTTV